MGTESRNPRSYGLDKMKAREVVRLMNEEEFNVFKVVQSVEESVALAAERVAECFQMGGRTIYLGSGTSGRIATMDAAEMPPTFGTDADRFIAIQSGGVHARSTAVEDAEDNEIASIDALNELHLDRRDVVIGLSASGSTAFVVSGMRHARQKGVWTCGIANNPVSTVLSEADLGILLDTGPEILTGSTRLKAGTAQKMVLNRISTAAMVLSGKVIENLMVDVRAKNDKLRERCVKIITDLTELTADEARPELEANGWNIRKVIEKSKNLTRTH